MNRHEPQPERGVHAGKAQPEKRRRGMARSEPRPKVTDAMIAMTPGAPRLHRAYLRALDRAEAAPPAVAALREREVAEARRALFAHLGLR